MKTLIVAAGLFILILLIAGASLPAAAAPLLKPGHTPVPQAAEAPAAAPTDAPCPTTPFAQGEPPDANTASYSSRWYGNDVLWAAGGPWKAGPEGVKVLWYRMIPGKLTVTGRRLDEPGGELVAGIPDGYGDEGLQASGLYFPQSGCWEVAGRVGGRTLRFVLRVTLSSTSTNTRTRPFPLLAGEPNGFQHTIAFTDTEGRRLYLAMYDPDRSSSVSVATLDPTTLAIMDKKPWPAFCERLLVVASNGTWICAYGDGEEGSLVQILAVDFGRTEVPESVGYAAGRVTGATMSSAGRVFVVTQGAMLTVFDVFLQRILTSTRLAPPPETADLPGQLLLSPDERRLYLGFERGKVDSGTAQIVRVYDTTRWNPVGDFDLTATPAWKLSLSSAGDRLYGISAMGQITAYDTTTLQRVAENP